MSNPLDMNATIVGSTVELRFPSHGEAVHALNMLRRQLDDYERMLLGLADLPAFPQSSAIHDKGMTLRDYLAAHAPLPNDAMALDDHCEYRYRYADAMLRARNVKTALVIEDVVAGGGL